MTAFLKERTWRELRVTSLCHGVRFHTHQTRQQGLVYLQCELLQKGRLKRALRELSAREWEALRALQTAGGVLPDYEFYAAFGAVRPYRPWQPGAEKQPWKRPVSTAEKLWHLGLIEIVDRRRVVIAEEVMALLPPLPRPVPIEKSYTEGFGVGSLLHDLAALFGTLLNEDVRPLHGKWLTLSVMRAVNQRALYKEDLSDVRSETQSGRIRFLHYLAEVSGLLALSNGRLLPTVEAWKWLQKPDMEILMKAVEKDLRARERLWDRYRFPDIRVKVWVKLVAVIKRLIPGATYSIFTLLSMLRLELPGVSLRYIRRLLGGALSWLGWVQVEGRQVTVQHQQPYHPQPATLSVWNRGRQSLASESAFYLDLSTFPALHPLTAVFAWAELEHGSLRIDADSVRRAVEMGETAESITTALVALTGKPLPEPVYGQLKTWVKQAARLTLHPLLILTSPDPQVLTEIRADWRIRPLLCEALSPHHLVIQSNSLDELSRKLERRGFPVTKTEGLVGTRCNVSSPRHPPDYLYLTALVYRKLGALIAVDVRFPWEVFKSLEKQLPEGQPESLDQLASAMIEQLRQMIGGKIVAAGGVEQDDPQAIQERVRQAYQKRSAITIDYFSPARGEKTRRTIEPIMLYERNGAAYVEAWCRLDEDTRTFRLDRIISVVDDHVGADKSSSSFRKSG